MNLLPDEGPALLPLNLGTEVETFRVKLAEFDKVLGRIEYSSLAGTARLMAQLALSTGIPLGEGPNGDPVPPEAAYRIHPALFYGGWVNPAKSNRGQQFHKRGEVVLGVPPSFQPKAGAMARAHGALDLNQLHTKALPPVVITTPKELGPRHARLLMGLLLDLVTRCADQRLEDVLAEVSVGATFRHRISQADFRRMVGRDLPVSAGLEILDDLRRTTWSIPLRLKTWSSEKEAWVVKSYNVSLPGLTATPQDAKDYEPADHRISHFEGRLGAARNTTDLWWDVRILGWCWSTAQYLKKKGIVGFAALQDLREGLLEETSPTLVRERLLETFTEVSKDRLRMGFEERHHRQRVSELLRDIFGVADGTQVEKRARRAVKRMEEGGDSQSAPNAPRKASPQPAFVTPSLFNEGTAGMTPEPETTEKGRFEGSELQMEIISQAGMTPSPAAMTPSPAGLRPGAAAMTPATEAAIAQKCSSNEVCERFSENPEKHTTNQERKIVIEIEGQGSIDAKDPIRPDHDLDLGSVSRYGSEGMTSQMTTTSFSSGEGKGEAQGWNPGFIPADACKRPWTDGEVKTYFQQPSHHRELPESILSRLVAYGLTISQIAKIQTSTCLTDTGIDAFLLAVEKGRQRNRIGSPAAVVYSTLTGPVKPSIVNWLADHHFEHRFEIQTRAEAEKALQKAAASKGWVTTLPVIDGAPVDPALVQAYLDSDIQETQAPALALGGQLLRVVPAEVRDRWASLLEAAMESDGLSTMVRTRATVFFMSVEALVHFGAMTPAKAAKVSVYRRKLWPDSIGLVQEPILARK